MIGVDPGLPSYRLVAGGMRRAPNELVMHGRSLLSALFYLSQGVAVPADDPAARELGRAPLTSPLLRVKTSSNPPKRAYAKARAEFRDCIRAVVAFDNPDRPDVVDAECRRIAEMFG